MSLSEDIQKIITAANQEKTASVHVPLTTGGSYGKQAKDLMLTFRDVEKTSDEVSAETLQRFLNGEL